MALLHIALISMTLIVWKVEAQCPSVDPNFPGSCLSLCDDDSECTGGTLCCSNGCGFSCVAPDANGTAIRKQTQEKATKASGSAEVIAKQTNQEETTTLEQPVKIIGTTTAKSIQSNNTVCLKPLKHNDGNILICGFAAGDFACPTTHSCIFDKTKAKFVCCLKDGQTSSATASESQVNPCPEGEPLTNAVGGKFTCSGSVAGPCPQGSLCVVGVCCPVVARPFNNGPVGAVGTNPDLSQKAGQCPVAQAPGALSNCQTECRFDGECLGSTKCCFTGCASRCTESIPFGLNPNVPFNPTNANGQQAFPPPQFGGNQQQQQQQFPSIPPQQQQQQQTFGPQFFNNGQTPGLPIGFVPSREIGSFQRPGNEDAQRQFVNSAPFSVENGPPRQIAPFQQPQPNSLLTPNPDARPTLPLFNNNNNNNAQFRPPPFGNGGDDRRNSFPFAPIAPKNNFNLNIPNQPILNGPAQTNGFLQPGGGDRQTLPQARTLNAEQFSHPSPVQIPVPNPDFVPFPNAPFLNAAPRQVNNENFFPFNNANRRAVEPRRDIPARPEQQQRLTDDNRPASEQKDFPSNDLCLNVQCRPCHRCKIEKGTTPKCVRNFDCCPDGSVPLGCAENPCKFVQTCPAHPEATCFADSCGICKAAFFDAEGNNVSCI